MRKVSILMHGLSLWLHALDRRHSRVATAERPFGSRAEHGGRHLARERVEEDALAEELFDRRRVLLDVADVVVEGGVLAAGLEGAGVGYHAGIKVVEVGVRDGVGDDDEAVEVQGADGEFEVTRAEVAAGELVCCWGYGDGLRGEGSGFAVGAAVGVHSRLSGRVR